MKRTRYRVVANSYRNQFSRIVVDGVEVEKVSDTDRDVFCNYISIVVTRFFVLKMPFLLM